MKPNLRSLMITAAIALAGLIPTATIAQTVAAAKAGCAEPTLGLVRLSQTMPAEATLGGEFAAELRLTATACAANVVVTDVVPAGVCYVRSAPAAAVEGSHLS